MAVKTPDPIESQDELQHGQMSFLDHLEELRTRILNSLIAVGIAFVGCWIYVDVFYDLVSVPIITATGKDLNFMSVTEPFNIMLKLSLIAAIFLSSPFLMAQVWLFVSPGLYRHERRYALPFIIFSALLFILGGLFGYLVAFPTAMEFLVRMGTDLGMTPVLSAGTYFNLFITVELALGVIFEIPAIIFILSRFGLITAGFLARHFQYAILLAFVVAAVITPTPDAMTMTVVALPMIGLYGLGIVIAFLFGKKRKPGEGEL